MVAFPSEYCFFSVLLSPDINAKWNLELNKIGLLQD